MNASCFYCCEGFDVKDWKTAITYIFFLFCTENCKQNFVAVCHGLPDDDCYPSENGINPFFLLNFVKEHDLKKSVWTIKEKTPDEPKLMGNCVMCNLALGDHIRCYYLEDGVCSHRCKEMKTNKAMFEDGKGKSKEDILLL